MFGKHSNFKGCSLAWQFLVFRSEPRPKNRVPVPIFDAPGIQKYDNIESCYICNFFVHVYFSPRIMLVSLFGLYLTLIGCSLFLLRPSAHGCTALFTFCHLSKNLLYGPLLARTWRIYRVFAMSARGSMVNKYASDIILFSFVFVAFTIQVSTA